MASKSARTPSRRKLSATSAIEFHDLQSETWSVGYRKSAHFRRRADDWQGVVDEVVKHGDAVLDMGCGSGDLSILATRRGAIMTCADGSAGMLAQARRMVDRENAVARFVETDVRDLPFDDAEFDVILASSLLEYVAPVSAALRELRRVVRPGGTLACSVPNRRSLYRRVEGAVLRLTGLPTYRRHVDPEVYDVDFETLLRENNFSVVECRTSGTPPFLGAGRLGDIIEQSPRMATMLLYIARAT